MFNFLRTGSLVAGQVVFYLIKVGLLLFCNTSYILKIAILDYLGDHPCEFKFLFPWASNKVCQLPSANSLSVIQMIIHHTLWRPLAANDVLCFIKGSVNISLKYVSSINDSHLTRSDGAGQGYGKLFMTWKL